MKISQVGIDFIKHYEGFRAEAYKCSSGIWTIGFGHTGHAREGMVVTEKEAENILVKDIKWAEDAVKKMVKIHLTQSQFDALVSFVFNIGPNAFKVSTMLRLINEGGSVKDIIKQFGRWVYSGSSVLSGLVKRREDEKNLFLGEIPECIK